MKEKITFKCKRLSNLHSFQYRMEDKDKDLMKKYIEDIPEDQDFYITLEEKRPTRTEAQHRYYWVYMGIIARESGEDKEALHEHFKQEHLLPRYVSCYGIEVPLYPSTKDLTIKEFMDYIKRIEVESGIEAPSTTLNGLDYYVDKGV